LRLLGLDIGTGGTRAIVIDEAARVVASASAEHPSFSSPEIGWGSLEILEHDVPAVLAHRLTADFGSFVALHNFAPRPATVQLSFGEVTEGARLSDLFDVTVVPIDERARAEIEIAAYGYRWFRIVDSADRRLT